MKRYFNVTLIRGCNTNDCTTTFYHFVDEDFVRSLFEECKDNLILFSIQVSAVHD